MPADKIQPQLTHEATPPNPPSPPSHQQIKEYELARVYNPSLARSPDRRYRTGSIPTTPELEETRDPEVSNEILPATTPTTTTTTTTEVPKHALINTIVDKYRKKFRKNRNGRKMATRKCDDK